jgi:hypothetical protein
LTSGWPWDKRISELSDRFTSRQPDMVGAAKLSRVLIACG